jgi:hypothetical protein
VPDRQAVLVAMAKGLARYRYVLAVVSAVLVLLALLPEGSSPARQAAGPGANGGSNGGFTTIDPTPGRTPGRGGSGTGGSVGAGTPGEPGTATPDSTATTGRTGSAGGAATTSSTGAPAASASLAPGLLPDPPCDATTGRLAVPTRYAPPCMPGVASNGGATYQGVTADTITVAVYINRLNPAAQALLTASGFNDSDEDMKATYRSYVDYFEHHYQTWGRKVKLVFVDPSGEDDDDAAARADAIRVATEIKAFASWGGPIATNAYADELAARKVLCICTVSQPIEYYTARAPYVISTLMSSTQGYTHRAEYVGKRLAGRPAAYAGDVFLAQQPRKFGLLYYETAEQSYRTGVEFFERELSRYGVPLAEKLAFTGANIDPAATQEQARTMIARLKEAGVTSVIFAGDPLSPVFFTQEATRQRYSPEWVLTGSAFTDTSFFARTYDQTQWAHAFGLSFLPARLPMEQGDSYRVHVWHHGSPPPAEAAHGLIYSVPWTFYTGLHLGGPALTPESIRDGLFRFPPTGRGSLTNVHVSFGRHGVWSFDDYLANDDATEVWWDGTAAGEDEVGNSGLGMYRYVEGGRRYLPGQHPTTDPFVFNRDGTVTIYNEPPPPDRPPRYEHKA